MQGIMIAAFGTWLAVAAVAAPEDQSERYGFRTFRERVAGVTVLADTTLAAPNPGEAYVPIVVAVGLDPATPAATVTRESFTLVDAGGNRWAAAGALEIRERYGRVAFDASLIRAQRMTIGQQFAGYVEIPSRFYGDTKGLGLVQDRVHLDPSTWFRDVVYFLRPPAGLGGILTLRLEGGGLESPIDVRFHVIDAE
jgi:hypothetical protein